MTTYNYSDIVSQANSVCRQLEQALGMDTLISQYQRGNRTYNYRHKVVFLNTIAPNNIQPVFTIMARTPTELMAKMYTAHDSFSLIAELRSK